MPGRKDMAAFANRMAPLGLLSIAAYLERRGHEVAVHDCLGPVAVSGVEKNVRRILAHHPDMVGISATTSGFLDGYDMAVRMKELRPDIRIVFGGVHISSLGGVLPVKYPAIDFLCRGEGEQTLGELADGRDAADIDGLIWRDGDRIVENAPREHMPNLDDLPFPAYEKLAGFPRGYNLPLFSYIQTPGATMITSRGCPYQCSYCDRSVFRRGYRYNSAEYIYEHLKYLREKFRVRHVTIYDDLFTAHRKRITRLCEMLRNKPLGMNFNCAVRTGHADDELLEMLKSAGFLQLSLGIETGDPDLMKTHKPGVYIEEVRDTVRRIQARGLRAKGLFMMGLPGETIASIKKTSDFVISLGLDDMNMSKFTPFHGAPLWDTIREYGELDEDWRKMNCLNFVFLPRDIPSMDELTLQYNRHVKRFYSDWGWRRRFNRRIWEHRKSLWYAIRHLPGFLYAMRSFEPEE
ncbi:MAG: B12-binding domain-containing radical SAM protein [Desulfobacterales bacterium]|nr:MAG: B12-binding domain-containing radical SAM protein [Desulfobacterales bacterium]